MTVDKTPEKIQKMFNDIATDYDRNNNIISLGLHKCIKKFALKELNLTKNKKLLDLCCGTGDIIEILSKQNLNLEITGADFSEKMLNIAKQKFADDNIHFINADATKLPFKNNSFDIITMFFGLRNIENTDGAINEILRVLKSEGEYLQLDFGQKNFFSKFFDFITDLGIKIFYRNSTAYNYLIKSKQEFFTPEQLIQKFTDIGFKLKKRKDFLFGIISMQIFTK